MVIAIEDIVNSLSLDVNKLTAPSVGVFHIDSAVKNSPTVEFFDDLYSYPPKFRVKWKMLDELNDDKLSFSNKTKASFGDRAEQFFPTKQTALNTNYPITSYTNGYNNKINSTKFFNKTKNNIQKSLETVPVYAILNGKNEIVLARSTVLSTTTSSIIKSSLYDFCGSFDTDVEQRTLNSKLGLFFMSREDAQVYLNEIAKSDPDGTSTLGVSIHCFGLDFAYRVMREYHPGIDFRFIPNLKEVQNLLTAPATANSLTMFEKGQQQLRVRHRTINILPGLNSIGNWLSPFHSFLQKTEYFKGVPIYIVKSPIVPLNPVKAGYFNVINLFDKGIGRVFHLTDWALGRGDAWILQGSLNSAKTSPDDKTYIFFEHEMALKFCQDQGRKTTRFNASRSNLLQGDLFFRKPKICVFNLEDFLERWEDTLVTPTRFTSSTLENSVFQSNSISFIAPENEVLELSTYAQQIKKPILQKIGQRLQIKALGFTEFITAFLNTN